MSLRMAAPWPNQKTGILYLRQRTPRDLVDTMRGRTIELPIGDKLVAVKIGETVQVSLGTKDARAAKKRHAIADAQLRKIWSRAREAVRLRKHGANPETLTEVARALERKPYVSPDMATATRLYGPAAKEALRQQGRPITEGSIAGMVGRIVEAFDDLKMTPRYLPYYEGDVLKFRDSTTQECAVPKSHRLSEIWTRWKNNRPNQVTTSTIGRYSPSISSFIEYVSNLDVRDVNEDHVYDWAKHRVDVGKIQAATVNRNDIVAIKSLLSYAVSREGGRLIATNPAYGVRVAEPRKVQIREKSFRDEEIATILHAASAVDAGPQSTPAQRAQRWCPWLAAYSGARISELTALRVEDIREERGCHIMHFRETKTGIARSVPLHEHIVEQGFLRFVSVIVQEGNLFTSVQEISTKTPAELIRSRKIAEWVRKIIDLDDGVSPNHGWRHTFKSRALGVMPERISDAITGHTGNTVARGYEHVSISMMANALKSFPRYIT